MMNTRQLIEEAMSLPVEQRMLVVESLLRSLNQPEREVDSEWEALARKRLSDLRSGAATAVAGDEVFREVWDALRNELSVPSGRSGRVPEGG